MTIRSLVICASLMLPTSIWAQAKPEAAAPTFNKDVAPIFQANCQTCHRPGEAAPMSLLTYEDARPWAQSIKNKVASRVMPPWHADPAHGEFQNDRRLTDKQIETITRWVDAGAPRGNPADLPAAKKFVDGWTIGTPDAVFTMTADQKIGASGLDEYLYFAVPTNFAEDRYVQAVEIRPGNRRIVHHVIAYIQKGGGGVPLRTNVDNYNRSAGPNFFRAEGAALRVNDSSPVYNDSCSLPNGGSALSGDTTAGARPMMGLYAPGMPAVVMPDGIAQKIPAGSEILFQIHYTKTGKEESDRTSIGFVFSKQPPKQVMLQRWVQNYYFRIPANNPNFEVKGCYTFDQDVDVFAFTPHMHVRGKDMEFRISYPDGRSEIALSVPKYDFGWQIRYVLKKPMHLPAGTRVEVVAHYDNSVGRKGNPDPNTDVRWGDPTVDEMLVGMINYVPSQTTKNH